MISRMSKVSPSRFTKLVDPNKLKQDPVVNPTRKLMTYLYNERMFLTVAIIMLLGGAAGEFTVPYYIKFVINDLVAQKYHEIPKLCIQLAIIVFVFAPILTIPGFCDLHFC